MRGAIRVSVRDVSRRWRRSWDDAGTDGQCGCERLLGEVMGHAEMSRNRNGASGACGKGVLGIGRGAGAQPGEKLNHRKACRVMDVGFRSGHRLLSLSSPASGSGVCPCSPQCVWNGCSWDVSVRSCRWLHDRTRHGRCVFLYALRRTRAGCRTDVLCA